MLTPEEIRQKIDYEIIVDTYDEYEMSYGARKLSCPD